MTLSAIHIANFKAFAASQRIPLRPITLIYGANSAGKSSILHALVLAHHAVETGELDTQRTQIGGESIDLGGFRQYVHRRDRERQVELAFELNPERLAGRVGELLRSARTGVVELAIGEGSATERSRATDPKREFDHRYGVRVERFSFDVDGARLLSMSARGTGLLRLDRLDHKHPVFRELLRGLLMLATTTQEIREEDLETLGDEIDSLVPGITAHNAGLFPRIEDESESSESETHARAEFLPVSRGRRQEDLARAVRLFVPKALRDLVGGLAMALEDEIRRLRYLGPLRSYPPRHLAFSQHHDPNWFAGGGHAWDIVRTRQDVRMRVNEWLGDAARLKTPYELVVRELVPDRDLSSELPTQVTHQLLNVIRSYLENAAPGTQQWQFIEAAADVYHDPEMLPELLTRLADDEFLQVLSSNLDPDAIAAGWLCKILEARSDALQDLVLIDKRSGTPVSHRDVGIGVSQVLPVLVSAYAARQNLLAIEQPEIHLHPALQAELGDVFLSAALGGGKNGLLIETHSEHLLLRIMRRLRETSTGKLPDGVPEVRPEDVMVLFVEPDGPKSIVREMPLNERGELVKAWPGGFFEEGLREIF